MLLKDGDYFCFDDIIVKIKELPNPEREMIKEVITLCKLILVNPATSAAGERFVSTARRLKTWLPSRMNQERFSNLTVFKCPYDQIFDIHFFYIFAHSRSSQDSLPNFNLLRRIEHKFFWTFLICESTAAINFPFSNILG